MGKLKKFIIIVIIIGIVYLGVGLYFAYYVESLAQLNTIDVIKRMPVHLWDAIKNWTMSI